MNNPASFEDLTEQTPLSKAMVAADTELISDNDFAHELQKAIDDDNGPIVPRLVEGQFSPTARAKTLNDGFFQRLAECDRINDALEVARENRLKSIQALLDERQAVIGRETSRLTSQRLSLDDLIAEQNKQKSQAGSSAVNAFEVVEDSYSKEKTANAKIKLQMLAALSAGEPTEGDVFTVDISSSITEGLVK